MASPRTSVHDPATNASRARAWAILATVTVAACVAADLLGLPSPWLFGALLAGLAYALLAPVALRLPGPLFVAGQATLGVALGADLKVETLSAVGQHWLAVTFVTVATLGISLGCGLLLARIADVDAPTASLGLVAGGASGIVAMSQELGADDRLVAFMQYLRVLVVVLLAPVVVSVAGGHGGSASAPTDHHALVLRLGFTVGVAIVGLLLAQILPLSAGSLLIPLVVAGALTGSGAVHATVPLGIQNATFVVIGLQVGLRFTPETVRRAGRLLPAVLASILLLIVFCAGLAALLHPLADVPFLDAYLATTPGGLFAVAAAAFGSGVDTTFVLAVQSLRLLVMVLAAPALVRVLHTRRAQRA